jgi:hypothetical protein
MTTALDELFASNPNNKTYYITIELSHSAFSPNVHRLVQGFTDLQATLEVDAPYNASEEVTFSKAAFKLSIPEKSVKGRQDLTCTIYGASYEIIQQLELQAKANREPVKITFREFESGDLTAPASQPITMTVLNPAAAADSVSFSATFADVINKQFPSIFYKLDTHPGLA